MELLGFYSICGTSPVGLQSVTVSVGVLSLEIIPQFMWLLIKNTFENVIFVVAAPLLREVLSLQQYLPSSERRDEKALD